MLYNQFYDKNVKRGMRSSPFDSTHDRTTSGVACHHRPWIAYHDQTISGVACYHRPWIEKHDQTTSGEACHHGHWAIHTARRDRPWQCNHRPWNVHTVGWLRVWHAIIALGKIHDHCSLKTNTIGRRAAWHFCMELRQHTRSDNVRRRMLSSPLGSISGWITSVLE